MSCETKGCHDEAEIRYLGIPLCVKHWTALAEAGLQEEKRMLGELGYCRVAGVVRTVNKEQTNDERQPVGESSLADGPSAGSDEGPGGGGSGGS